jgi:hypothetical protein
MSLIWASMNAAEGVKGMLGWNASGLVDFMTSTHCRWIVIARPKIEFSQNRKKAGSIRAPSEVPVARLCVPRKATT